MAKAKAEELHPDKTRFGKIHTARRANRKLKVIRVPAWDTEEEECRLYAYPLTVNEVNSLEAFERGAEQNVMQIIRQCLTESGEPYFTLIDKPALMNEPADLIGSILVQLNADSDSFAEELKKNQE